MNPAPRSSRSPLLPAIAALSVAGILLLAGCGGSSQDGPLDPVNPAPSGPDDVNPSTNTATPVPGGNVDEAVDVLDEIVQQTMEQSGVPGMAVSVVSDGETVYSKGFGVREVGRSEQVEDDTVFQIASISKPVGSTAVAGAVEAGEVEWDDRIVEYLPDFKLSDPDSTAEVTIADMYSHRSGLPGQAGNDLEGLGYDRNQILERLRFEPVAPIRTQYSYSNFGLTAGAEAVARATGMTWEELVETEVYEPLGMTDSSSSFSDYKAAENRAWTHVEVDGEWEAKFVRQPDAQSPAGGVSSTASDMARWMEFQLSSDSEALLAAHTPQVLSRPPETAESRPGFYGFGWNMATDAGGQVRINHSGAFAIGAATNVSLLPALDLGITVLTNGQPIGAAESVASTFMDVAEFGRTQFEWYPLISAQFAPLLENESVLADRQPPANAKPAGPDSDYTGTYANEYFGDLKIESRDGKLISLLGPDQEPIELKHWNANRFSYFPPEENGPSLVTFRPKSGSAQSVTFELYDSEGLGTFTR